MTNKKLLIDFLEWGRETAYLKPEFDILTNPEVVSMYLRSDRDIFKPPPIDHDHVVRIFNNITGKRSILTKSRKALINGRAEEGNNLSQFQAVFLFKYNEWKEDPEMKKFITLDTMLRASKFQNYLEQARADYIKRRRYGGASLTLSGGHWANSRKDGEPDFNV